MPKPTMDLALDLTPTRLLTFGVDTENPEGPSEEPLQTDWLAHTGPLAGGVKRHSDKPFEYRYRPDGSVEIRLTQGQVTVIDAKDLELVQGFSWVASRTKSARGFCAVANSQGTAASKQIRLHRMLLNASPDVEVDHRNHDTLDNRRDNLRAATRLQNSRNVRKRQQTRPCTSIHKGVCWDSRKQKWMSRIYVNGRHRFLGYFDLDTDAAQAYDVAAAEMFGEFAHTNSTASGKSAK